RRSRRTEIDERIQSPSYLPRHAKYSRLFGGGNGATLCLAGSIPRAERCSGGDQRTLLARSQCEQSLGVAVADLVHVALGQVERFHHCDGGADVAAGLLRVERAVGGEQHVVGGEERDAADGRRTRPGERGVAVEPLEVVERPFLQP